MARIKPIILFLAADEKSARAAAAEFNSAANRLGLPWIGAASGEIAAAQVVVPLDGVAPAGWNGRIERWGGGLPRDAVNGLIARLLGGSESAASSASVPAPSQPGPAAGKKVHTAKLSRETAGRRGKGVTVVSDLPLTQDQLRELATHLKSQCGTGGTVKDGRIEIQGDQRDRIAQELEHLGYKVKRSGG
jgi:predicted translation initiation factor SUI1